MPSSLIIAAQLFSIVAFFSYGVACFFSEHLAVEFKRWGLEPLRKLTGVLEVLGASGLLVGFANPMVRMLSAAGLAFMMVCALAIRAKMRDRWILWVPAIVLLVINLCVVVS